MSPRKSTKKHIDKNKTVFLICFNSKLKSLKYPPNKIDYIKLNSVFHQLGKDKFAYDSVFFMLNPVTATAPAASSI